MVAILAQYPSDKGAIGKEHPSRASLSSKTKRSILQGKVIVSSSERYVQEKQDNDRAKWTVTFRIVCWG